MPRTKGSKNGVSHTKGYTAVGKTAKGRWVNGRYVYDEHTITNPTSTTFGIEKKINKSSAYGAANDWQNQAAKAATGGTVPKSYNWKKYNSLKIKAENRQKRAAEYAKKFGKANNWQQNAAKASAAGIRNNTVNDIAAAKKKKHYADTLAKGAAMGDAAKAADAQRKAEAKARWNAGNKAAVTAQSIRNAVNKGSQNNWQQNASRASAAGMRNSIVSTNAANAKKNWSASYNKMGSTQKNAMQGDPRYSTGYNEIKDKKGKTIATYSHSPLMSTPNGRDEYDYRGNTDPRAPTMTPLDGPKEKMNRDPYFKSWANASNIQEEAKAISKNKEFMNDFRESKIRNSRSDIGNALADAKEEAKAKWKSLKKSIKNKKKKK